MSTENRLAELAELLRQGPSRRGGGSLARRLVRKTLLRATRPFASHQAEVDRRVLDGLRQLEAAAAAASTRIDECARRIDEGARRVDRVDAETHAIPFMQGEPFATMQNADAGTVMGYRTGYGSPAEAPYRAFEDVFRGSEELVRDRQRRYLPIIGAREPVLDFGCGRGELLDLLRDEGISCIGVDSDEGMVARCRDKGHRNVVHGDGLEYLAQLSDHSLGVVFTAQVIEHLTGPQLRRLLSIARSKLTQGGLLIAETVNPHSPQALKAFWVDLSHQRPIFPEVALEFCREAGFESAYVFHPNGTGDVERDRFTQGEYAVVASVGGH